MTLEILKKALDSMGMPSDDISMSMYEKYMEGILEWNQKVNLTNITDRKEFELKHFVDSVICCDYPEFRDAERIIDVGTGGGFPGIPLAITSPSKQFILMDSLKKRLRIIDELCDDIGIGNVTTVHARAEELARNKEHREKYDLCVSRAVANMAVLCEYCLPFIKVGGYFLAYKGPDASREAEEASKAVNLLGGKVVDLREGNLRDFAMQHKVLVIKKVKSTPSKFPRKAGMPVKEPLK